jgi:hypothetical protein
MSTMTVRLPVLTLLISIVFVSDSPLADWLIEHWDVTLSGLVVIIGGLWVSTTTGVSTTGNATIGGNAVVTGTLSGTRINSFTAQPGFLAYNSADDAGVLNGATVQLDTEVYDDAGNFAGSVFTAPVTGRYLFCGGINTSNYSSAGTAGLTLFTSNRSYMFASGEVVTGAGVSYRFSGSVIADMDVGDTASLRATLSVGTVTVLGGAPGGTWLSGRLIP